MNNQPIRRGGWPGPRKDFWGFRPSQAAVDAVGRYMHRHGIDADTRGARSAALEYIITSHPETQSHERATQRPTAGPCPLCGSSQDRWCKPDCAALDPMDYR